jgi:quinol monooxygenase YgiN
MPKPVSEAIVVTAEFWLKHDRVNDWLRLMLEHYGPACVVERGMLRYWLHHEDDDEGHVLLYEQWADRVDFEASLRASWREAYLADTQSMWEKPRIVTTYKRIETPWEPLDPDGLPESFRT